MRERTKNKLKKNLDHEVSFQFKLFKHELEKLFIFLNIHRKEREGTLFSILKHFFPLFYFLGCALFYVVIYCLTSSSNFDF
jgi:hypothetical protein